MRDGKATKFRISQAALTLFVEKGVTETTVRDIAKAAGIAEGTLYRHFASKDELAWELFAQNFTDFAEALDQRQAQQTTVSGKIGAMVHHFCTFFDQDPVLFSYLLLAQHEYLKRVLPDMPNPADVVQKVIWRAMSEGKIPLGDSAMVTAMLLGIVLQAAVFKIYGRITTSLARVSDTLVAACLRVLNAPD